MNFLWIYLVEKGGGINALMHVYVSDSQPLLQNRLMDVYKTW